MSDLTIKGNVVSSLGTYLPTPYIQQVEVHGEKLVIKCSLYLNFLDKSEEEISDIIADLQHLQVYTFYALGPEYSQRIIDKKVPNIFKEFAVGRSDYEQRQGTDYQGAESGMDIRTGSDLAVATFGEYTLADWTTNWSTTLGQLYLARYTRKFEPSNYHQTAFSNFTRGDTAMRDEADNQIIEFSYSFEIDVYAEYYSTASARTSGYSTAIWTLHEGSGRYIFEDSSGIDGSLTGLTLFAFSSFLDYNSADQAEWTQEDGAYSVGGNTSLTNPTAWAYTTESDYIRRFNAIYPKLPNRLATKQISNIAYENIFKDKILNREPQILYVMQGGANYHDTPIQIGSGTYYTQDGITLEEITAKFQELVDENQDTTNENLKNIVDNMSFILETYGESHNLLVKLGNLGRAFTSKTTATPVGKLYQRYKKRFSAVNAAAERGTSLKKELQRNLKIRDLRGLTETLPEEYTAPAENTDWFQGAAMDTSWATGGSYPPRGPDRHHSNPYATAKGPIIYTPLDMGDTSTAVDIYKNELAPDSSDDFMGNLEYGYFFVDQEKAIRYYSNIAKLFDIAKIEHWFGKGITNLTFKFDWANIVRRYLTHTSGISTPAEHMVETYFDYTTSAPEISIRGFLDSESYADSSDITISAHDSHWGTSAQDSLDTIIADRNNPAETNEEVIEFYELNGYGHPAVYSTRGIANGTTAALATFTDYNNNVYYFHSYIIPRNVTTVYPSPGGDYLSYNSDLNYRLMCFEYQFITTATTAGTVSTPFANDYSPWDPRINYPGVGFIDNTFDIFREMVSKFETQCIDNTSYWQEYLSLAAEPCNFNSITGQFNDFFKDAIKTHFENISPPPWIITPILYYMHLDILHNKFGGDRTLVVEAAKTMSDQINPKTGNITAAQDFNLLVQTLYDEYYAVDTGVVRNLYTLYNGNAAGLADRMEQRQVEFGGSMDGYAFTTEGAYNSVQGGSDPAAAWAAFPGAVSNGVGAIAAIRAFIWDASDWQETLEDTTTQTSPDDPGIGMELGRSAIFSGGAGTENL